MISMSSAGRLSKLALIFVDDEFELPVFLFFLGTPSIVILGRAPLGGEKESGEEADHKKVQRNTKISRRVLIC